MDQLDRIVLPKVDEELMKVVATMCVNLQKEYDIAPRTLAILLGSPLFANNYTFLYQQCHSEMIDNVETFKRLFNENCEAMILNETEKCGYIISSHQNGYVTYCNLHKYLHPHPQIHTSDEEKITHQFILKTKNQITTEKYMVTIYHIYEAYINKLYLLLYRLFEYVIKQTCNQTVIDLSDAQLEAMLSEMQHNQDIFKSKTLYEHITTEDTHLTKYYYVKIYHLNIK
jgi:hypothetical protein